MKYFTFIQIVTNLQREKEIRSIFYHFQAIALLLML